MRGTRSSCRPDKHQAGIIPAYAGNTRHAGHVEPATWDHPRVCGEHLVRFKTCAPSAGSSPRMRGTLELAQFVISGVGIIPAYAGNTRAATLDDMYLQDHPRVCGEHLRSRIDVSCRLGSSPRMRGTHRRTTRTCRDVGDHPRVCGEHELRLFRIHRLEGSSPRMRGTHWAYRDGAE